MQNPSLAFEKYLPEIHEVFEAEKNLFNTSEEKDAIETCHPERTREGSRDARRLQIGRHYEVQARRLLLRPGRDSSGVPVGMTRVRLLVRWTRDTPQTKTQLFKTS